MAPGLLNGVVHRPVALAAIGAPDLFQLALGLVPPWMVADAEFDAEKKRLDIEDRFQTGGRNPRLTTTQQTYVLTRENLRTPKAAAIAGMLFSVLTMVAFWLLWNSVPDDPQEQGMRLYTNSNAVALGLNPVPFAGLPSCGLSACCVTASEIRRIASLQLMFFGSGLLFLGSSPPRQSLVPSS